MFYVFYYELNIGVCDFQIAGFLNHLILHKVRTFLDSGCKSQI